MEPLYRWLTIAFVLGPALFCLLLAFVFSVPWPYAAKLRQMLLYDEPSLDVLQHLTLHAVFYVPIGVAAALKMFLDDDEHHVAHGLTTVGVSAILMFALAVMGRYFASRRHLLSHRYS